MDKEQARFILGSYRPGMADGDEPQFALALALAAENRELGEWLARERALDAAFADALRTIPLPESLREDILGCLEGERHGIPEATEDHDAAMIGALAALPVPSQLRGNILAAMEAGTRSPAPVQNAASDTPRSIWRRLSIPLAAAAGIALALLLTKPGKPSLAQASRVPIGAVPVSFISTYESPSFDLELKQDNREVLVETLKARSLPCPCCLPPGLKGAPGIGCRELTIEGRHGSLICFALTELGPVHLVIFRREDVDGSCSNSLDDPCYFTRGEWAVARWQNSENVFFVIGKTDVETLKKLF